MIALRFNGGREPDEPIFAGSAKYMAAKGMSG